jgi:hypothetical protein
MTAAINSHPKGPNAKMPKDTFSNGIEARLYYFR